MTFTIAMVGKACPAKSSHRFAKEAIGIARRASSQIAGHVGRLWSAFVE